MIRLMLVDDSKFMRTFTKNLIMEDGEIQVVKEAKNGEDALQQITNDIDVVLLDIEMPKLTGLEVLERWNKENIEIPVIMFSSLTRKGAEETIKALDLGAFDFIEKPHNPILLNKKKDEIISKIKMASNQTKRKRRLPSNNAIVTAQPITKRNTSSEISSSIKNLVLIGCSTGGPKALKEIIPMFPGNLNAAILIVQHMPSGGYTKSLADSLNKTSQLNVYEAQNGQTVENGCVYIAPGGKQMKINLSGNIVLTDDSPENGHAPSVDYMFREVFKKKGNYNLVPVVLTGMGGDGSKESLRLSKGGLEIIVESENTCVVFGMPKKVIESGAKNIALDLEKIPNKIIEKLK
ncbi:chemotaxis-specific protein-glutamate methyltransferase CheB [Bacillus mexicanus]|uniref:chemotaxis-specific protein-glutamate methyltransferase CheB n=1 Tax=Bacillus mexicanus TaxID=2834415 RepID=UPI003D220683